MIRAQFAESLPQAQISVDKRLGGNYTHQAMAELWDPGLGFPEAFAVRIHVIMRTQLTKSDAMKQLPKAGIGTKRVKLHRVPSVERKCVSPVGFLQHCDALVAFPQSS